MSKDLSRAGWKLWQKSDITGDQCLWITPTALKVENLHSGVCTVAQAPDWQVRVSSKMAKQYYETPHTKLDIPMQIRMFLPYSVEMTEANWRETRKLSVNGIDAHELKFFHPEASTGKKPRGSLVKSTTIRAGLYTVSNRLAVSPQAQSILKQLYLVPQVPGFPIDLKFRTVQGGIRTSVETTNVEPYNFDPKDFAVPKGYAKVRAGTVFAGAKGNDFDNMAEFLGDEKKAKNQD